MTNKKLKLAAMSVALTACSILRAPYTYSRSQVRVLVHQIPHAHVLLAEGVILIKRLVAAMLTGHIGAHVGTARRHADVAVELHALFHAAVQHTGPVNAPQPAAHSKSRPAGRNFRCLRGGFLHL